MVLSGKSLQETPKTEKGWEEYKSNWLVVSSVQAMRSLCPDPSWFSTSWNTKVLKPRVETACKQLFLSFAVPFCSPFLPPAPRGTRAISSIQPSASTWELLFAPSSLPTIPPACLAASRLPPADMLPYPWTNRQILLFCGWAAEPFFGTVPALDILLLFIASVTICLPKTATVLYLLFSVLSQW